ncbi:Protein of unknown function [Pyronema omphalodes CBS 100304]|uniref:Uncharacterized protein n=1 Tax=Pyronema omphalodes (strain CBS 100304) TaxID=1076935 RepID=U4LVB5_PYROM|nr:Protein of unknown function [Pyronema omphalodes CBS 100304]
MCHFRFIIYTICGCTKKRVIERCSRGDGAGDCDHPNRRSETVWVDEEPCEDHRPNTN